MTQKSEKVFVVIPAFEEEPVVRTSINNIIKQGYKNVIVVDDGSVDKTFEEIKKVPNVIALRHTINRGKGAASKTGAYAAIKLGADIIVMNDADGQHQPEEIDSLVDKIKEGNDVVLGSRTLKKEGIPFIRMLAVYTTSFFMYVLSGIYVTDPLSGFRAFTKDAFLKIDTQTDRFEYEMETVKEIARNKLKFAEVPITIEYTDYSEGKTNPEKFTILKGIKTMLNILFSFLK